MKILVVSNVGLTHIAENEWGKQLKFFNDILFVCLVENKLDDTFEALKQLFADRRHNALMYQIPIIFDWGLDEDEKGITIYQVNGGKHVALLKISEK